MLLVVGAIIAAFVLLLRRPSPESAVADKSIAVLPFENLSSEKENAYFTDGVTNIIRKVAIDRETADRLTAALGYFMTIA